MSLLFVCRASLVMLLCMLPLAVYSAETAALNELTGSGLEAGEIVALTNALRSEISRVGVFEMLERSQIEAVLREQGFQASGACSDASCAIEIGQLLSVRYMILGNVGKVGETYSVSVRRIDVGSGKVVADVTENYKGSVDHLLTDVIPLIAERVSKGPTSASLVKKKRHRWPLVVGGVAVVGGAAAAAVVLLGKESKEAGESTTGVTVTW